MRDILIFAIVAYGLTQVFRRPHIGIYLWTWISLMNPHRLAWGFASSFPFAQVIGIFTIVGFFTGKTPKLKLWHAETVVIALLVFWVTMTTFVFAFNPKGAYEEWDRFIKIQIFIFLTIMLVSDKGKLDGLVWVMALSVGFYGIKGGVFTVSTGGSGRVWGPEGSFIAGNNELALALLMTVPLFRYLQLQQSNKWIKHALTVAMLLCMLSIVGTQSRGALLGIVAIGFFLWMKSRSKLGLGILLLIVGITIFFMMPESWWDRMGTIKTYEEDSSAMSRLRAWEVAWNVAKGTFVGGGANMWNLATYERFGSETVVKAFDVHSIYFEMLGEQGFPGFFLFMLLGWLFWRRCSRMISLCKDDPEKKWAADLAAMLQVSFIGYAVSGSFLGLAYFDYYYDLIAVALIASQLVPANAVVSDEGQMRRNKSRDASLQGNAGGWRAQSLPGNRLSGRRASRRSQG
jgi:probable O-glycosylation ligase (exosortase A-associated)